MKPRCSKQRNHALTLVELLVIIAVLVVFAVIILPPPLHEGKKAQKYTCLNNLEHIGLAYKIWAGDNHDKFPMEVSTTNGGVMELAAAGNAAAVFLAISNELNMPKALTCPEDREHQPPATNFSPQLIHHISYFVGLNANQDDPQSFLSGDDNFEISSTLVKSSVLEISSNNPIAWSSTRHKFSGNILLSDGSVQVVSSSMLTNWPYERLLATNRIVIP